MPIVARASTQWDKAQHAYDHYQQFIASKRDRFSLSFTDLVYVTNFKGGSATIREPVASFVAKLNIYEKVLRSFDADPAFGLTLSTIPSNDYNRVRCLMVHFVTLPVMPASDIDGFGSSFASALLHFHFPLVAPILDKRALNGSGVPGLQVNGANTVTNLLALYPALIDACRARLQQQSTLTLRELDRMLFIEELKIPPFH